MKKTAAFVLVHVVVLAMFALPGRAETASPVLTGALQESYNAEKSKDYAKAIEPLEKLGTAGNSDYIVQYRLGWLNYCNKQYDESISHYKKAVQLAPNAVEPLLGLMTVQMTAGKNDDALRTGQSVLTRDPNSYTATSRIAWLCYLEKDYRRAASLYRKLATLYPTDTEMLMGLGFSLKLSGETKDGDACFQKVLLLSPGNARALEGLKLVVAPPAGPRGGGGKGRR